MSVKLRLKRTGTHKNPFYWIVAADTQMPRDGRFLEKLGIYNPQTKPTTLEMKTDRIHFWLDRGALPTEPVRELLRGQGLLKLRAEAKAVAPAAEPSEAPDPGA